MFISNRRDSESSTDIDGQTQQIRDEHCMGALIVCAPTHAGTVFINTMTRDMGRELGRRLMQINCRWVEGVDDKIPGSLGDGKH